jgi:hypothetical protein
MTPDQINAAIAESQGWRTVEGEFRLGFYNGSKLPAEFPNYHGSLDAIVPVARAMPKPEYQRAVLELCKITIHGEAFSAYVATPEQWCEAYLKAKGLRK